MTNHPDDISYPRCSQCHDDLVRCPACRHFEAGGCLHAREAVRFTPDGEAAKACPGFRSRNEVPDSRMRWNVPAPVWVSALLLLILAGLVLAAWFIDPAGRYIFGNPLRLETVVPAQVTLAQPFNVVMRITNLLDRNSTRIYIEVGGEFLASAAPGKPVLMINGEPALTRIGHYHNSLLLEAESLPANGQAIVQLPFTMLKRGSSPFIARVYAPSNQLRHVVKVPIEVKDPGIAMLEQPFGFTHRVDLLR